MYPKQPEQKKNETPTWQKPTFSLIISAFSASAFKNVMNDFFQHCHHGWGKMRVKQNENWSFREIFEHKCDKGMSVKCMYT